jgi:predicted O-methyltransferase YrrM
MSTDVHTMNSERALDLQTLLSSTEYGTARDFFRNDPYWQKSITGHEGVALLYELVRVMRPSIVVEIGTFEGRTAQAIARALLRNASGIIHTVSPFDRERFLPLFERWPEDVKRHARYHALSSMDFYMKADQEGMRFDLVFVDGNHDYEFALFDIQAAASRMMPGGVIVIDNISQAGPYYATVDFLRARPEWADCGTPRTSISRQPYDRKRANVPGTDFMILQGPSVYYVGSARPVSFNIFEWHRNSIAGVRLMLSEQTSGTVHAQCILRGFGDDQIEVASETAGSIGSQNEITLAVPITIKEMARYSVETWLTWDGAAPLKLRAPPAVY